MDLPSRAFAIWKSATEANPELKKLIEKMPDKSNASREANLQIGPRGALVYTRLNDETDAMLWIDENGEVRELTAADLRHFRPAVEVLDPELYAALLEMNRRAGVRGPQKAPTKQATTIRLSPEVMAAFKATGAGWQTRIDDALKDWQRHAFAKVMPGLASG